MYEGINPRAEKISPEQFNSFLEDSEFKSLVADIEEKMTFGWEGEDEDGTPISFETASGYEDSLREARIWLDTKGIRVTDKALAKAIALRMGGEEFADFVN